MTAVRFVDGRVLISTGAFGRELYVIDVTDPAAPRRAGNLSMPGTVGYFHPLPDHQALVIGSRDDEVGEDNNRQFRSWVQVHLLDVAEPDAPAVLNSWERPWSSDNVAGDHHAFTYWPYRKLAMWGIYNTEWNTNDDLRQNHAVVLGVDGSISEVAVPVANKPEAVDPPCPTVEVTDPDARQMIGPNAIVLGCADREAKEVEWPRYECYSIDAEMIARFAPGEEDQAAFFMCSPRPWPSVGRVLVVGGKPMLLTEQTLEALDPQTFASTQVAYHPSELLRL